MQVVLWIFALFSVTYAVHSPLFTEFEWKYFDYVWKSQEHKNYYMRNGLYAPKNLTPIDVDRTIGKESSFYTLHANIIYSNSRHVEEMNYYYF